MAPKQAPRPARPTPITAKPKLHPRRDLTAEKTRFVAWLLGDKGGVSTQVELAKVLGVDNATLSDWKHDDFVLGLLRRANEMLEPMWAEALANLVRIATQKSDDYIAVRAISELAKILGKTAATRVEHSGQVDSTQRVEVVPAQWPEYDKTGKIVPLRRSA